MGGEHEKQDDSDKYERNGHEPDRGMPPESPGGKHEKEGSRVPAKSGEAEQGQWVVEVVAGPAYALDDVDVAGFAEHGDGEVS